MMINAKLIPSIVDEVEVVKKVSEPIKEVEQIQEIVSWLLKQARWRDCMLFVVGINLGLRVSDLTTLKFNQFIDNNFKFKDTLSLFEQKTGKPRVLGINDTVKDVIRLYIDNFDGEISLDRYLFVSEGNRGKNSDKPLTRMSIHRILKDISLNLNLKINFSSHSLRKTFGHQLMSQNGNDPRTLLLLQRIFNHSSAMQTLTYIGLTDDEVFNSYNSLNYNISSLATSEA